MQKDALSDSGQAVTLEITAAMIDAAWVRTSGYWDMDIGDPVGFFTDIFKTMFEAGRVSQQIGRAHV